MGLDIWSIGCIFAEMARNLPLLQGDCEIDQLFRIFRFVIYLISLSLFFSLLGTPTDEVWQGVTKLPDYKATFPKWEGNKLEAKMKEFLCPTGLDLLQVRLFLFCFTLFFRQCSSMIRWIASALVTFSIMLTSTTWILRQFPLATIVANFSSLESIYACII
jgi:hypothetical protein